MQGLGSTQGASCSVLLQRLQHFQSLFTTADASGDGSLDEGEFLDAFRSHLGNDDRALRRMFHAIDANCDGSVTWEEFSAYLLLEKTAAAAAGADEQSPDGTRKTTPTFYQLQSGASSSTAAAAEDTAPATAAHHQAPISCLVHPETSGALDRWYSTHTDGVVQVWNGKDLGHMRTYHSGLSAVTSAAYLPSSGLLALGSYSRFLQLMDPSTGRHAGNLHNVASTASLSLAAWTAAAAPQAAARAGGAGLGSTAGFGSLGGDGGSTSRSALGVSNNPGRDYVAVGDADGSVRLLQLDMGGSADKKTADCFSVRKLWNSANHRDWVTSVLHCPEISSVAAASLDKSVSITDLEKCIPVRTLKGHTKAVNCCAWNSLLKVVASGSADRRVLLFNPFSCRSLGVLEGHAAPVVCLASNERDMQLISAAADNTIKVWDLRNQRCLQTLQLDTSASLLGGHQHPLSVLGFSPAGGRQGGGGHHQQQQQQPRQQRMLVAGSVRLRGWALSDGSVAVRQGHREAVSWVGYVQDLQEVVSTDHAGTVCCWDVQTGQLLHSFGNAHGGCRISTAAVDEDCRRLITGAEDGSISVWNFRSGRLLSAVSQPPAEGSSQWGSGSGVEVTGLAVATTTDTNGQTAPCIVATGWDRKVTWYADTGKRKCQLLRSFDGADSDVLAAAAMPGASALATACDNGEVYLWNLESGAVMRKLLAPGLQARPPGERSVEAVAFMHEGLKHILVAVGADCVLRFWDSHSGHCLEHDCSTTQHSTAAQDKVLCAVAVSPDNSTLVTADTAGSVAVWDVRDAHSALLALEAPANALQRGQRPGSALPSPTWASALGHARGVLGGGLGSPTSSSSSSRPQSPAAWCASPRPARTSALFGADAAAGRQAAGVRRVAGWKAHAGAVTALLWVSVPLPSAAAGPSSQDDLGQTAAGEPVGGGAEGGSSQPEQLLLFADPSTAQQQGPLSQAMGAAEGQQQAQQLLAAMQQQQRRQQQQKEELPDARLQQLAAAIQGMHAAAAAVGAESADGAAAAVSQPAAGEQGFIISAGLDRTLVLWSTTGGKVGLFGSRTWQLEEPSTWREPPDNSDQVNSSNAAGPPGALLPQHSMDSTCSTCSSDLGLGCEQPSQGSPLATAGDSRLAASSQTPQQQRTEHQQQSALAEPQASCWEEPGTKCKQGSPRQPGQLTKAVVFADDPPAPPAGRSSSWNCNSAAAAATVAAATAEARPPVAEHAGSSSSGILQQQQQQMVAALDGGSLVYAPRASSWQSAMFGPSAWPGGATAAAAASAAASEPEVVCLAAEEDLPTSLWLPEFTRLALSRPASAAAHMYRPASAAAPAAAGGGRRPSTAGVAATGVGLHSRAHGTGRVLAAAGRHSVMLDAGIGGGVLMGGRAAGNVSGAGPLGRPKSAGVLQAGRRPGNCER